MKDRDKGFIVVVLAGVLMIGLTAAMMYVLPIYGVWKSGLSGEAKLRSAEQTKQISVLQAQAEKDSAQLRADAIKIMGQAAKEYPEYREQEFMASFGEALREGNIQQVIYVPTEANIPVMEAGKR